MNTCTRGFHRHACRLVAAIVLVGAIAGTSLPSAFADPIGDKQAKAKALSDQIDALGRRESALAEQYNAAVLAASSTAAKVNKEQLAVSAAQANAASARGALQINAIDAYVHGGSLISRAARNGGTQADGGLLASEYVNTLAATQRDALDAYRNAATTAKELTAQLQSLQAQQAKAANVTDGARRAAAASSQQLTQTLSSVKGDIATLVAQAEAAKQASALAAAQALAARASQLVLAAPVAGVAQALRSAAATLSSTPIPVGVGAGAAIAAAKSRLGMPYVWGASGPDSFDCSGLIMWSWAHAGVSLPHFSGAMYASTQHIPMSALQPGDLVFPSNPGDHVAMYIGGGQVIEAPHSGDVVHIVPMYSWFVLASRV